VLSANATAARREGEDYMLEFDDGRELRGDRLLVATGRRPRVRGLGLETVGVEPDAHGVPGVRQARDRPVVVAALWRGVSGPFTRQRSDRRALTSLVRQPSGGCESS
jgi:hypothetical protein